MSTPTTTPRTDAASALTSQHRHDDLFGDPEFGWVTAGFARTLERELATERARLDSGQILLTVSGERVWHCGVDLRAAIDAAMKEGAK